MIRSLIFALLASVILIGSTPLSAIARSSAIHATQQIAMFDTEQAAQAHCPSDTVVWLNTNSGIYHEKGMRWYGRTRHGAYVCKKEADAAGYRDTRNGQ